MEVDIRREGKIESACRDQYAWNPSRNYSLPCNHGLYSQKPLNEIKFTLLNSKLLIIISAAKQETREEDVIRR